MKASNKRPLFLTLRVVLYVAITISLCLIVVWQLLISSIEHHFMQQDADELGVIVHSVEKILASQTQSEISADTLSKAVAGHHGVYYQINYIDNQILYSNANFDLKQLSGEVLPAQRFDINQIQHWFLNDNAYRGITIKFSLPSGEFQLIAVIDMTFHLHFLKQLKQSLGLILIGSCILTLLTAWFGVHQGLGPLRGLSSKMQDIQTNKLDIRLHVNEVPPELEHMVLSFNHMLNRLEDGFNKLSNFSADIAHELRTPLTNIITQTQVSLSRERTAQEYQNILFSNLEELERLSKMISDMLWLAKSQNGLIAPIKQPLNISDEIAAIFDFFEALADEAKVKLQFTNELSTHQSIINADKTLLRHALTNLLSNAIRHTPIGKSITVNVFSNTSAILSISIENPGEIIPEEHLPFIFERFYRADQSRQRHSDGAGLGLAITKGIIEAHQGSISVRSTHSMTVFLIELPVI